MRPPTLYIDYRSPFSFIASVEAQALEREFSLQFRWLPYAIDLKGAYGGAVEQRTERDWRKVRYSYADARRKASRLGLTVLGPEKIYDPMIAHIGMLVALDMGRDTFFAYHDAVCTSFWKRELDIEDLAAMTAVADYAGMNGHKFAAEVRSGRGQDRCRDLYHHAEEQGVFGVPTFIFEEPREMYWGVDHLPAIRERIENISV